jgi:hypothetical protein
MLFDNSHVTSGQFSSISEFICIYTSDKFSVFFMKFSHLTLCIWSYFKVRTSTWIKKSYISVILDNDFYLLHLCKKKALIYKKFLQSAVLCKYVPKLTSHTFSYPECIIVNPYPANVENRVS